MGHGKHPRKMKNCRNGSGTCFLKVNCMAEEYIQGLEQNFYDRITIYLCDLSKKCEMTILNSGVII